MCAIWLTDDRWERLDSFSSDATPLDRIEENGRVTMKGRRRRWKRTIMRRDQPQKGGVKVVSHGRERVTIAKANGHGAIFSPIITPWNINVTFSFRPLFYRTTKSFFCFCRTRLFWKRRSCNLLQFFLFGYVSPLQIWMWSFAVSYRV